MDVDEHKAQSLKQKAEALHCLSTGSLSSSTLKLSRSSRAIPSERDFHFFYNFDEFKSPVGEISEKSRVMLERVGTSVHLWGKDLAFPKDLDDAHDWLVNTNDELFEQFDVSADEFQSLRKKEEDGAATPVALDDGFQLVCRKKKKGVMNRETKADVDRIESKNARTNVSGVNVASRDKNAFSAKPKVPFHIRSIPRPQDEFNILANNSNQPFEHVWLQRSEDGTHFVHPLEAISYLDLVNKDTENIVPVMPPLIEHTPFTFVDEVKDLKALTAKLRAVDEFAVDLEHNQYRSFQGITCLMQISTRNEDFIVDTLKLRIHIGPHLREVFKDPIKRKVMHGADKDILWLQRDFGIYVCNLFDTGQAARVLNLERNSLKHLLDHYCGVTADKEYQNADWRLRPLPYEMVKYAREDTHHLLHIYDLMRVALLSTATNSENFDNLLVEVYKRSYDVCMQLYEKELLTESSYLHIYGLQREDFNCQQLAIVSGLCEWRDAIARAEDESTGYVLPNKTLLEIAKVMPVSTGSLRRLLKMKHTYVERNIGAVVSIIKQSIKDASAFEVAAQHLKKLAAEHLKEEQIIKACEASLPETAAHLENGLPFSSAPVQQPKEEVIEVDVMAEIDGENGKAKINLDCFASEQPELARNDACAGTSVPPCSMGTTVPVLKKPSRAFGALLGASNLRKKLDLDSKKEQLKLEQIKSSVNLPFHSFPECINESNPAAKVPNVPSKDLLPVPVARVVETSMPTTSTDIEGIIVLDDGSDVENLRNAHSDIMEMKSNHEERKMEEDGGSEGTRFIKAGAESEYCHLEVRPFDYEAALEQFRFGESPVDEPMPGGSNGGVKAGSMKKKGQGKGGLGPGKRRQAFPSSGNRSATFLQ